MKDVRILGVITSTSQPFAGLLVNCANKTVTAGNPVRVNIALVVGSPDEQEAWRDYLRGQGVECTDVFDRGAFRSIYLRDPDGHIVEIATSGPGFRAGGPSSVPPV